MSWAIILLFPRRSKSIGTKFHKKMYLAIDEQNPSLSLDVSEIY